MSVILIIGCAVTTFAGEMPDKTEGIPYIEFYAENASKDPAEINLSDAVSMTYNISECEFAYPLQRIKDEESIRAAIDFFSNIYVTGEPDGVFSTEGGEGLSLQDKDGNTIISIFIQAGMIDTSDGRREAEGLSGISEIPGLMSAGDWEAYYAEQKEAEEAYHETHELSYPCSLFEAEGKAAFDFYQECTADDIDHIYFFHNGKNKSAMDRDDIQKIYDSICQVQVTGIGNDSRWGDKWSVTIFYTRKGDTFTSDIQLSFHEGVLYTEEECYALEGLEAILGSYDWDELAVIAEGAK